jgi:hypothetical protein
MSDRANEPTAAAAVQGSVFLTGQVCSREQRRGRYTRESLAHPGKMLPSIARYLIRTYTDVGDWVCDPMAGIATTIVEAMHLRRHGIGVEFERRWAALAADNLRLATSHGATGTGEILQGDSRHLPALIPAELHGKIALVITSPRQSPKDQPPLRRRRQPRLPRPRHARRRLHPDPHRRRRDPATRRHRRDHRPPLPPPRRADRHPRPGRLRWHQRRPAAQRGMRCAHRRSP